MHTGPASYTRINTKSKFEVPLRQSSRIRDAGRNATLKESDARRVGCAETMESGPLMIVFLLLARGSAEEKGVYVDGKGPVLRSIEGREESFVLFTYAPVFTVG